MVVPDGLRQRARRFVQRRQPRRECLLHRLIDGGSNRRLRDRQAGQKRLTACIRRRLYVFRGHQLGAQTEQQQWVELAVGRLVRHRFGRQGIAALGNRRLFVTGCAGRLLPPLVLDGLVTGAIVARGSVDRLGLALLGVDIGKAGVAVVPTSRGVSGALVAALGRASTVGDLSNRSGKRP